MVKYRYINDNGIAVHNIKDYLASIDISYDELDLQRKQETVNMMKLRGNERGITFDEEEECLVIRIPYNLK